MSSPADFDAADRTDADRVSLAGRRILVIGGSKGIGLEVSRGLARRGARVVVAARGQAAVRDAVAGLEGGGHDNVQLDVSDLTAWTSAMRAVDEGGPLHGLVTAAGVLGPIGSLEDVDPRAVTEAIHINLLGTMWALRHCLPRLKAVAGRAVTFTGGGATAPLPRYDAYAVSKAAVARLTENIAAAGEIEINAVAPGFVATGMHEGTLAAGPEAAGADYYRRTQAQLAQGGFPASRAADLVAFLLSDAAAGISGRVISAQWDPWRDEGFRQRLRQDPSLARLRRIDAQFFGALPGD
jgi:NAD(P)-dependent dehydrogenase (short-subunit alcohol dehydrogenase family)